jgi:hypothetical protein
MNIYLCKQEYKIYKYTIKIYNFNPIIVYIPQAHLQNERSWHFLGAKYAS